MLSSDPAILARPAQADEDFAPKVQHIPEEMPAYPHRTIRKMMDLVQAHAGAIEARQHHTPALSAQVYCRNVARGHALHPPDYTAPPLPGD